MSLSFQPTLEALKNLESALKIDNPSDLERDGTVQRFEYCYEILWKLAQKVLQNNEVKAEYPKVVFRELGRLGWIDNVRKMTFEKSIEFHELLVDSYKSQNYNLIEVPFGTVNDRSDFIITTAKLNAE